MFHVVLFEPEIPPNTGNIIRLCANTGAQLHLIEPLGFNMDDKRLQRAGLDYHEWARVRLHQNLAAFQTTVNPSRIYACSTHGQKSYADCQFNENDAFLFGPETRGLRETILSRFAESDIIRIPMREPSRSLNLANAVAVIVYEAWRQQGYR